MQSKDGKRRKEKTITMFEDMEMDAPTIVAMIGAVLGGGFAWVLAESMMPGNFLIKTITMVATAIVCFVTAQKIFSN